MLSITQNGIKKKDVSSGEGQLAKSYKGYQWVFPGDFAMNHMDLLTGWVDCSEFEGVTSPDYRVFCPIDEALNRRYYTYLFQHCYSGKVFYGLGQGVSNLGRWRMPADEFNNFQIPVPPIEDQNAIASYLDKITVDIDKAVEEIEQSIELLQEYRCSVISEVVTRGLDSNVPMKDSGVEWIDEIPVDWEVFPLKALFSYGKGLPITKADLIEVGVPIISYGQIHSKANNPAHVANGVIRFVSSDFFETNAASYANEGDFIFADTSEDVDGCGNFVHIDREDGLFAGYHTVLFKSENKDNSRYLSYLFQSQEWRSQIRSKVCGVKLFSVTQRVLNGINAILPTQKDQEQIADYLDGKTADIDALVADKQKQVELLKEYRKSLISEAVTGKFKVPGLE